MSEYNELESKVINWADERGIFKEGTPLGQASKTLEEATELLIALATGNHREVVDSLGDTLVTLIILATMVGIPLESCLQHAYNEIKDREGVMKDGVFVKSGG